MVPGKVRPNQPIPNQPIQSIVTIGRFALAARTADENCLKSAVALATQIVTARATLPNRSRQSGRLSARRIRRLRHGAVDTTHRSLRRIPSTKQKPPPSLPRRQGPIASGPTPACVVAPPTPVLALDSRHSTLDYSNMSPPATRSHNMSPKSKNSDTFP
jgi:hypothetical protein